MDSLLLVFLEDVPDGPGEAAAECAGVVPIAPPLVPGWSAGLSGCISISSGALRDRGSCPGESE